MLTAVRVATFTAATLTVKAAGREHNFPSHQFPQPGMKGSTEHQLDAAIRRLCCDLLDHSFRVTAKGDGGEDFVADFTVRAGRFDNVRRSMAEALVARAAAQRNPELLRLAELLDGLQRGRRTG